MSENKQGITCSLGFCSVKCEGFLKNVYEGITCDEKDNNRRPEISSHSDYLPHGQLSAAVSFESGFLRSTVL